MRSVFLLVAGFFGLSAVAQPDTLNIPNSTNGWYLSPHGTIRVLVLFAELVYDTNPSKDPQPTGADHWPKGGLPRWKDEVFDPYPSATYRGQVTRYYHDISLGRYTVLGDYVDTILTLRESEYPSLGNAHGIGVLAVKEANKVGVLRTHHGLTAADFDLWKRGGKPGMPKQAMADVPHSYDHVMVIVRNSGLTHGQGSTDSGTPGKLFGYDSDSQSRFGGMNALPFEILKHEFNHLLLGGNNFHSGGGNAAQFESYTLCVQGGWSMMGAASSSLLTCSAWDRDRLGWVAGDARHRINARNVAGAAVSGDVDPLAGDTGVFVLRDFVTTGDAMRIRMPFIPAGEHPQWLWLENHRTYAQNGSPTDRFHWEATANPCVAPAEPGLFAVMQIARDNKYGADLFGGSADYLRPLLANGQYDLEVTDDTLRGTCPFGGQGLAFRRIRSNPLSGNSEQELMVLDRNGDGIAERGEHFAPSVLSGEASPSPRFFGRPEHAFRINGTRVLSMGSNPGTANMLTLTSAGKRERSLRDGGHNRTIRLNGIRIELLEARADGSIAVRVSTGETRIDTDVIWCADSLVLPALRGREGRSLIMSSGKRMLIDRSITPTRMTLQEVVKGRRYFAPPTRFTFEPGATATFEKGSGLELMNGSLLHLLPGSELAFEGTGGPVVDASSAIIVHEGARLVARKKILKKLRKKKRLIER